MSNLYPSISKKNSPDNSSESRSTTNSNMIVPEIESSKVYNMTCTSEFPLQDQEQNSYSISKNLFYPEIKEIDSLKDNKQERKVSKLISFDNLNISIDKETEKRIKRQADINLSYINQLETEERIKENNYFINLYHANPEMKIFLKKLLFNILIFTIDLLLICFTNGINYFMDRTSSLSILTIVIAATSIGFTLLLPLSMHIGILNENSKTGLFRFFCLMSICLGYSAFVLHVVNIFMKKKFRTLNMSIKNLYYILHAFCIVFMIPAVYLMFRLFIDTVKIIFRLKVENISFLKVANEDRRSPIKDKKDLDLIDEPYYGDISFKKFHANTRSPNNRLDSDYL